MSLCRKRTYASEAAAEDTDDQYAYEARMMGQTNYVPNSSYQCPRCGGWHLTRQLQWQSMPQAS
jgi:hypothetical protein